MSDFRCLNLNLFSLIFQHDLYCLPLCNAVSPFILCTRLVSNLLLLSANVPIPSVFHIHPIYCRIHAFLILFVFVPQFLSLFFLCLSLLRCSQITRVTVDKMI